MFFLSQYNRDWRGPLTEWPSKSIELDTDECSLARHNAQIKVMYQVYNDYINNMIELDPQIIKFLSTLHNVVVPYGKPQQGKDKIYKEINDAYLKATKCHGVLGNDITHSSYWYLIWLLDLNEKSFNEKIKIWWPTIYKLELKYIETGEKDEQGRLLVLFSANENEYNSASDLINDFIKDKRNNEIVYNFKYNASQQTGHLQNQ